MPTAADHALSSMSNAAGGNGSSDRASEDARDAAADHAPAPAEIEDRGEEDAQCQQPEPAQLEMLLALPLALAALLGFGRGGRLLRLSLLRARAPRPRADGLPQAGARDAKGAKKYLVIAQAQLEKIEKFLGH